MSTFPAYPKTPRFNTGCLVTEKIDGTNALIQVVIQGEPGHVEYVCRAGSRKRWLTLESDNFGFARFVAANEQKLGEMLGEGLHYGEWYGSGIQRTYGLVGKRLALFDGPGRYPWALAEGFDTPDAPSPPQTRYVDLEGGSIGVVPLLYQGSLEQVMDTLFMGGEQSVRDYFLPYGSKAVPGFENSEGVIVSLRGSGGGERFKIVWSK